MAKSAAKAKKESGGRLKVRIQHKFTIEEYQERTQELTSAMKKVDLREEAVKAAAATAKAEIKEMKSHVNDLANQLRNGYEERDVDAVVEMDRKKGIKKLYHFAPGNKELNGKLIRQEPMTEEDFALLPLDEPVKHEAQPPAAPEQATQHPTNASPGDPGF
jgi:hypothetical protein